jgi:hypothetical protein
VNRSQIGATDLTFINTDPTGPLDFGKISPDNPTSSYRRALGRIPEAVRRIKATVPSP